MDIRTSERLQGRIYFKKTQNCFSEVISSYNNKNYRSATVILWSVVIFDVVLKLQHLVDMYDDTNAKSILDEVKTTQDKNPYASDWELNLIENVCNKTDLIEFLELESLKYLQKQRNLSAHPIIRDDMSLYRPNDDIVRSLIITSVDSVLSRPPIYTRKIINNILKDLEDNKDILTDIDEVYNFSHKKYLIRLSENASKKIFKSFWKFTFRLDNDDCNRNRIVNARFISALVKDNLKLFEEFIEEEVEYFSNIEAENINVLVQVLDIYPSFYPLLNDSVKIVIDNYIQKNVSNLILGSFKFDSIHEFYLKVDVFIEDGDSLDSRSWRRLYSKISDKESKEKFLDLLCKFYSKSFNFDEADKRFDIAKNYFSHFSSQNFSNFIGLSESNNQTYWRGKAGKDYFYLESKILEQNPDFDFESFIHFKRKVSDYKDDNIDNDIIETQEDF